MSVAENKPAGRRRAVIVLLPLIIFAAIAAIFLVALESGVDPAKVKIVPNGIDPERFRPEAKAMALRTKKSFKFLFVGGTIIAKAPTFCSRLIWKSSPPPTMSAW